MSQELRSIALVSLFTMGSRVLGLVRDALIVACFGSSIYSSAFFLAFTFPNLFRRLLGEGAMTSAVMPIMAMELERSGRAAAFQLLNQVLYRISWILLGFWILGSGLLLAVDYIPGLEAKWYAGARLSIYLFPYMPLVCLAALFSAGLNLIGRFGVAAMSPIWLNLTMIFGLGVLGNLFGTTPKEQLGWLCFGVFLGGIGQVAFPAWALRREGWVGRFDTSANPRLQEMWVLFLPGVAGAAVLQINIVVSRFLAFGLDSGALSLLYIANRLVELPLGIFTIAVATVVFPKLARLVANDDHSGLADAYGRGLRLIWAITFPSAAGLMVFADPILSVLFQWGAFDATDVADTVPLLQLCAAAIPLYSWATMSTRGFHSLKDTKTPVQMATVALGVNIGLSLILMQYWGVRGLAAANLVATFVQCLELQAKLKLKCKAFKLRGLIIPVLKISVATLVMILVTLLGQWTLQTIYRDSRLIDGFIVAGVIPLGIVAYLCALWIFKLEEFQEILGLITRFFKR